MVDVPPEEPDEGESGEGRILAPDELDITESEHVEELEEGRFVVSPDGSPDVDPEHTGDADEPDQPPTGGGPGAQAGGNPDASPPPRRRSATRGGDLTEEAVHRWLRESLEGGHSRYAFDVTATFDGRVSQRRMASNDVVTIFESLVLWYAQQVDSDTPVEDVLGILLAESNVPVRYPPESIHRLIKSANLSPDDSIAELLEEIEDGAHL